MDRFADNNMDRAGVGYGAPRSAPKEQWTEANGAREAADQSRWDKRRAWSRPAERVALAEGKRWHKRCPMLERELHKAGALREKEGLDVVLHSEAFLHSSGDHHAALALF
eukprot:CAMPEP_0118942226 /NCGR_PEP_ID=MMETSP1169-20130426/35726_1 /TAXON_ID=36882 /ORGANISM="Pyramimonas obovata, Strain CCMP722" /LENGTH=109 /DNA_ID=CAMNT_0006887209 /DNA_START=312 /DNA_END=641 /DNA_ORIENTATION=+